MSAMGLAPSSDDETSQKENSFGAGKMGEQDEIEDDDEDDDFENGLSPLTDVVPYTKK
ncbi:hypothetical protein HDU98_005226, partial [Podochytrium sp. JEL0797]